MAAHSMGCLVATSFYKNYQTEFEILGINLIMPGGFFYPEYKTRDIRLFPSRLIYILGCSKNFGKFVIDCCKLGVRMIYYLSKTGPIISTSLIMTAIISNFKVKWIFLYIVKLIIAYRIAEL